MLILSVLLSIVLAGCDHYKRAEPSIFQLPDEHFSGIQLSGDMTIEFLGLQAGESTLVRFKDGSTILIDTGHPDSENTLIQMLREEEITDIQYLVLTYYSKEYIGNTKALLEQFNVETIVVTEDLKDFIIDPEWNYNGKVITSKPKKSIKIQPDAQLYFLGPEQLYESPQNNAMVFQLRHGDQRTLFTSAINAEAEKSLMASYDLQSEILKISDFGRIQGSYHPFIEEIDPQVAVVFHPGESFGTSEEVVERLKETWADVYSIKNRNVYETVKIISNGKDYEVVELDSSELK